ncbi:MAG: hypothetical protein AAB336_10905, partial [Acidobacteriota bacterium]
MKSEFRLSVLFPFQTKRLPRFTWIIFVLLSFCFSAWGADDVQQIELKDAKQTIKQAEKLLRKGEFIEAEKLMRDVVRLDATNVKAKTT